MRTRLLESMTTSDTARSCARPSSAPSLLSVARSTLVDMPSDYTLRQRQSELTRLRSDLYRASETVASSRMKAAKAREAAAKSRSESTIKTKLAESAREDKRANDAEAKRAGIEKSIAAKERAVNEARSKYEKEVERERNRALEDMSRSLVRREQQFHPFGQMTGQVIPVLGEHEPTDVFISHASEDKDEVARPLAELLTDRGVKVWFDELSIGWGQPLRRAIERGIANTTFGLVIISPTFLTKTWTQAELDALFGRQMDQAEGYGLILPVWHRITADEVQANLPMLAGIKALNTAVDNLEKIADELAKVIARAKG